MITLFVPVYNEEKKLVTFINELNSFLVKNKIFTALFINDGSNDNTKKILDDYKDFFDKEINSKIKIHHFSENKGVGSAFKEAIELTDTEYLFFLPSDNDISFKDISNLKNNLNTSLTMLFPINIEKYSNMRYLLSMIFRTMYCFIFNVKANYIQSPCLYKVSEIKKIKLISKRFSIWPEVNVKLLRSEISYTEIPVKFNNESIIDRSLSVKNIFEVFFNLIRLFIDIYFLNKEKYRHKAKKIY